jgi:hypothetical protein
MRVPRVRFTVRQLMIAAALVAVLMAVGVGLQGCDHSGAIDYAAFSGFCLSELT